MNRIVLLTGIPGSGKTTVLDPALSALKKKGVKYKSINYGTVMFEIAKDVGLVKRRDDIRKLDIEDQRKIQKAAGKKIALIATASSVIVDTHCTIITPHGYLPGLPEWVLKEIMPDTILLIEASPSEIRRRRKKDKSRERDNGKEEEIDEHQKMNRSAAISYSILTDSTIEIIHNHDNKSDEAIRDLLKILG